MMSDQRTDASTPRGNIVMHSQPIRHRLKPMLLACAAGATLFVPPALAQDSGAGQAMTVDPRLLVERIVDEKVITREQADRMVRQETVQVQQQSEQMQRAITPGGVTADGTTIVPYFQHVAPAPQIQDEKGREK